MKKQKQEPIKQKRLSVWNLQCFLVCISDPSNTNYNVITFKNKSHLLLQLFKKYINPYEIFKYYEIHLNKNELRFYF